MSDGNPAPEQQPTRRYPPIDWEEVEEWRQMSGEEKVLISLRLRGLARMLCLAGIRHQHPEASEEEVLRLFDERLKLCR